MKWRKVFKAGHIDSTEFNEPQNKGVFYAGETVKDIHGGQHTKQYIAKDGIVVKVMDCYHGYHRHQSWQFALQLVRGK